ncbi:hypothetical protein D9C73_022193 [Collichthys lucidus]|uniref:Uncharacterized protein n=1 Tax=Collichthys lucidus TaxID=240159 RepID=A0A4U5VIW0_COLLU|nr:hypothetical protein D9C73_022193 [Collichthys lucidus]
MTVVGEAAAAAVAAAEWFVHSYSPPVQEYHPAMDWLSSFWRVVCTLLLATVNHQSPLKPVGLPFVQTSPPSVVQRSGVRTDSVSCWITLTEE